LVNSDQLQNKTHGIVKKQCHFDAHYKLHQYH